MTAPDSTPDTLAAIVAEIRQYAGYGHGQVAGWATRLEALARGAAPAAQPPVAWMSADDLALLAEEEGPDAIAEVIIAKSRFGNFTAPVYAAPPPDEPQAAPAQDAVTGFLREARDRGYSLYPQEIAEDAGFFRLLLKRGWPVSMDGVRSDDDVRARLRELQTASPGPADADRPDRGEPGEKR